MRNRIYLHLPVKDYDLPAVGRRMESQEMPQL